MKGSDHGIMEAAAHAKRALEQKKAAAGGPKPPRQTSTIDRAVAAGIWVAAIGSLAAVIMAN
jgi:hypothetical protein